MAGAASAPPAPAPPNRDWLVWFDLGCDDVMALEPAGMTQALRQALEAIPITIHQVSAPDRKAAIEKAFPKRDPANAFIHGRSQPARGTSGPH